MWNMRCEKRIHRDETPDETPVHLALVICIKREAARGSSGFLSGWYFKESCL